MKRAMIAIVVGVFALFLYLAAVNRRPAPRSARPVAAASTPRLAPAARPIAPALASLAEHDLGLPSCDEYRKRFAACDKLPVRLRQAFLRSFEGYRQAAARADKDGSRELWAEATDKRCDRAGRAWQTSLQQLGC